MPLSSTLQIREFYSDAIIEQCMKFLYFNIVRCDTYIFNEHEKDVWVNEISKRLDKIVDFVFYHWAFLWYNK